MRKQEPDIDECRMLLLNKALQIDAPNAQWFVDYITRYRLPAEIRQYSSSSIEQVRTLFHEVMASLEARPPQFQQLLIPQPPSLVHVLQLTQPQPQMHPSSSFPGNQAPVPVFYGQPQFDPSGNSYGIQPPFSLFNGQPQFYPSGSFYGTQLPWPPIGQIGPPLPQFGPSIMFSGMQPPLPPNVLMRDHPNAFQNVPPHRSSKAPQRNRIGRCHDHFVGGCFKYGRNCQYSHESYIYGMRNEWLVHSLETLPKLDEEIRQLLISQQPSLVSLEHLPMIYFEKYGKSLLVKDFQPEPHYSLICLLIQLGTIKVIESDGQHYVFPEEDALDSSGLAADSKLVLAPPTPTIITEVVLNFSPLTRFTVKDAWNYFRKFGPVSYLKIFVQGKGPKSGFVTFMYPETVKLLSSETIRNPHLILDEEVWAFPERKHERVVSGQEVDAHANSGVHKVSDVNVSYVHHTGEKSSSEHKSSKEKLDNQGDIAIVTEKSSIAIAPGMVSPSEAESSDLSNRLDKALAAQDIDDSGL